MISRLLASSCAALYCPVRCVNARKSKQHKNEPIGSYSGDLSSERRVIPVICSGYSGDRCSACLLVEAGEEVVVDCCSFGLIVAGGVFGLGS